MVKPGQVIEVGGFKGFYSQSTDSFGEVWHTLTNGEESRHWHESEWPFRVEAEAPKTVESLRAFVLLALAVLPAIMFVAQMMS